MFCKKGRENQSLFFLKSNGKETCPCGLPSFILVKDKENKILFSISEENNK